MEQSNEKIEKQKETQFYKAVSISMIIVNVVLLIILIGLSADSKMGMVDNKSDSSENEVAGNIVANDKVNSETDMALSGSNDDPMLGDPNAPVVIEIYSDFECPYCKRFYDDAYQDIKETYVESGQVVIIFKDFPLTSIHKNALAAANGVQCANDQDMGFEMHDKIFDEGTVTINLLKAWAVELGLNSEEFDDCLDSGKYEEEAMMDLEDGRNKGVTGTPTIFVNDQMLVGARSFTEFKRVIDNELNS